MSKTRYDRVLYPRSIHHYAAEGMGGVIKEFVGSEIFKDVNEKDDKGHTPTFVAAIKYQIPTLKMLLAEYKGKINLDERDNNGHTPAILLSGSKEGYNTLEFLFKKGVDANQRDAQGNTLFH